MKGRSSSASEEQNPSQRTSKCWYCDLEMLYTSLKTHTAKEHPGKKARER